MSISENLAHLHEQITEACRRSNRPESEVALMAVSKVHPVEAILEAYAAGQRLFGENRVQEFQEKSPRLKALTEAAFHLIGPLQSNKTAKAAELFDAIDAVDSLKIAAAPEHNRNSAGKEAAGADRSKAEPRRVETRTRS